MIEIYTFAALAGLGYFLSKPTTHVPLASRQRNGTSASASASASVPIMQSKGVINPFTPSNPAQSTIQPIPRPPPVRQPQTDFQRPNDMLTMSDTQRIMKEKTLQMPKYLDPYSNKVIPHVKRPENTNKRIVSKLSGEEIFKEEFIRGDVLPFFGGSVKQPMHLDHSRQLGEMSGDTNMIGQKKEQVSFVDLSKDMTNMHGNHRMYEFEEARMNPGRMVHGVLPFKQETVGKGVGGGYTSAPSGNLNQDSRDYVMRYKTVDEIRMGSNPKQSYEGRVVEGMKPAQRGYTGEVKKNRVDTYYENNEDRYFVNTPGAFEKAAIRSEHVVKEVQKTTTLDKEYMGPGYNTTSKNQEVRYEHFEDTRRSELPEFGARNPAKVHSQKQNPEHDYGKGSIRIYDNERKETLERTYEGNLQSLIKSLTAPLLNALRPTNKENLVSNPRVFGSMNMQVPEKPTLYDSNDVARTTLKETQIHDTRTGQMSSGLQKGAVYDSDDVARTTLKETQIHDTRTGQMSSGLQKGAVYDSDDVARTTLKETQIHDTTTGQMSSGVRKGTVYDSDDVTRTTLKETQIHDTRTGVLHSGVHKGTVYDDEDAPRTTIKETQIHDTRTGTLHSGVYKGSVYDDEEAARTTIKETNIHDTRTGVVHSGIYKGTVYDDEDVARTTIKETNIHNTHSGQLASDTKTYVYDNTDVPRTTIKDVNIHNTHSGQLSSRQKRSRVYDPDIVARTTGRETLKRKYNPNVQQGKHVTRMPLDDKARDTLKEFTEHNDHTGQIGGNVTSIDGGYKTAPTDLQHTAKQFLSDKDHYGNASKSSNDGYKTAPTDLQNTIKQFVSDHEHYGHGGSAVKKERTNEAELSMRTNVDKDMIAEMRNPTTSGVKVNASVNLVNYASNRNEKVYDNEVPINRIFDQGPVKEMGTDSTREKTNLDNCNISNRLDIEILKVFKENPYTQPLDSVV